MFVALCGCGHAFMQICCGSFSSFFPFFLRGWGEGNGAGGGHKGNRKAEK